ncbi:related to SRP40 Suppressor of mutant AC40 of RNA polymerase I and III [Rhynchosporium agropyri]|uniref:Related to SRP40 Suppressor of mutant AC40 of RNA polymerase I and III n=1 Tax=Rhynchosporium agropyri TaxID=914238 RepID=A0A1E1LBU0_9HELO|nr:related to SRP40 Suppressor of mutant AC40 of RNA polymerase I and III [Rhynchosporium agropyri]
MEEPEYTRLHITPFTAGLLKTILPPSILPNARNISYHSILTFPERDYGYVELPSMDAEKIRKKLNGTTLKGTKVRVETARPLKEAVIEKSTDEEPERPKRVRKPKRKRDELPGVDIGERQVKRGWTTPAKDAKQDQPVIKSKYTTGPECLFKTNLPPNVASKGKIAEKLAEPKPEKKKRKPGKEAVVHEFAKTTKYATFLRGSGVSNNTRIVVEFVEGKGWVDEEGNVMEEARKSPQIIKARTEESSETEKHDTADPMEVDVVHPASEKEGDSPLSNLSREYSKSDSDSDLDVAEETEQQPRAEQDSQCSSSESSSSSDSEEDRLEETTSSEDNSELDSLLNVQSSPSPFAIQEYAAQDSSSSDDSSDESIVQAQAPNGSSSSSESSDESDSSDDSDADSEVEEPQSSVTIKSQGSSGPSLSIKIPGSVTSTPITSLVHPLEALYKRPKSGSLDPPKAVESSFSFFGADEDQEEFQEEDHHQVPLTPYTQKDFEYRGLRSAAPTPDTAHPNKRFLWPSEKDEEEDDEEEALSSPIRNGKKAEGTQKATEPETDFQKWFYENRGDVRRAWTGRKKAAAKEKRQRENRKRDHRAI